MDVAQTTKNKEQTTNLTVEDIGEQGLLQIVQRFCPASVVGDDAALLKLNSDRALVVTTDVLVDGVHFSDATTTAEDVGWRAAAANLSDLAAMGADPLGITVGLSLPPNTPVSWVEGLYRGLSSCLERYRTDIVGGDITRSPVITVAIAAFGQVFPNRIIRRADARIGDAIVVTGFHGNSRAGLEILLHPDKARSLDETAKTYLIQSHRRPLPRLDSLPYLHEFVNNNWRVGGMDSSDGLADAVIQICRCSGTGAEIEVNAIPRSPALRGLVSAEKAIEFALYGGEDFELVLCLSQERAEKLVRKIGEGAAIIGKITERKEVKLVDSSGIYPERLLTLAEGFQHF